jgi:chromate reductase
VRRPCDPEPNFRECGAADYNPGVKIIGLSGSLRQRSFNTGLLRAAVEMAPDGVTIEIADLSQLPLYNDDVRQAGYPAPVETLRAALASADAVLFATPEYNYSVPGVLKNAIDWASRPAYQSPFFHKKCFMITLSAGAMGGVRAQGHLKQILNGMAAHVFPSQEVVVPFGNDKVEDGRFTHEPTLDFALLKLEEFSRFVRTA